MLDNEGYCFGRGWEVGFAVGRRLPVACLASGFDSGVGRCGNLDFGSAVDRCGSFDSVVVGLFALVEDLP